MLRELHITNLAVIADARIELDPRLNCFTGATGAGKSLVIGALEVLLGLRSPAEMLRQGAVEGRVTGVFQVANPRLLEQIDQITDLPVTSDGGDVLLARRLYASGRSSVSLNGHPITLGMLKGIAETLVDVHGQHDHQYLLKPSNQLELLDSFGHSEPLRDEYRAIYARLLDARRAFDELSANRSLRRQQLELRQFQADEIDAAELNAEEFAELSARASVLVNLGKLKKEAGAAYSAMYEAEGSVLERLKMITGVLGELATLDAGLTPIAAGVKDATIQLEESAFDLSRYLDRLDLDPAELGEVNERLNTINRVLNKYGGSIDAALSLRQRLGEQIAELQRAGEDLCGFERAIAPLTEELNRLGRSLSQRRAETAKRLVPQMEAQLRELGMEKAKFSVSFEPAATTIEGLGYPAGASGFDQVEFIAQTNPGLSAQPLRKIASGGELSRMMLALKGILAQSDRVSVLVFDEIDANVGGRLGAVIGEKLRALAEHHQVLCITHLSQIAAYADRHLTVRKEVQGQTTTTKVRLMEGDERLRELADMIGGRNLTDTTLRQAAEMLSAARQPVPTKVRARRAVKLIASEVSAVKAGAPELSPAKVGTSKAGAAGRQGVRR